MLPIEDRIYFEKHCPQRCYEDLYWGFTQFSREDYADVVAIDAVDEVMYGVYSSEGGGLAEIGMRWYRLQGEHVPGIEIFSDAFLLLDSPTYRHMWVKLQEMPKHFSPSDFSHFLLELGFQDDSAKKLK